MSDQPQPTGGAAFRRRVALGAAVGSMGGLILAFIDALLMRSGIDTPPALSAAFAADAGLVLPLTAALGAGIGVASWLTHPEAEPSFSGLLGRLRDRGKGQPTSAAAFAPMCIVGLFLWATIVAQLARIMLSIEATPMLIGAVTGAASLCLGAVFALVVLALTPWLDAKLVAGPVDPVKAVALALAVVAVLVVYGAAVGSVSGEGGLFGIYGILKRQELDLRLPAMLLSLALAAYLSPPLLRRLKPYQALLIAGVPLILTARAAVTLNEPGDLARHIERGAPLAKTPLSLWRKLTDRDGDGASPYFGGGDCNDGSAAIGPASDDVPDNGIDEDCSGEDLSLAALRDAEQLEQPAVEPTGKAKLPKDGNLVLITVDTLRHDLGYTGYKRPITPNIDALAKRGTIYEVAYALASYTGKSVGPMLIGKYGSETHRNWGHFNKFSTEDTFIAERFKKQGIHTIAVHGHRYFGKFGGLERGFDVLDLSAAPDEGAKWATANTVTSDKLTDAAIAALDAVPAGKRYFLWVHYLDPHADYKAHDGFAFGNSARDMYDGEVAYTDQEIGRLLERVAKDGERTSIIVTSDHGESFGDHKVWRHGVELWEVLVRVPLVVYVPGVEPKRVAQRRSLIDLVPTMMELMGTEPSSGEGSDFLSGVSWVPDWFSEPAQRNIMVDMPGGPYNESRRAFIAGDLKLTISGGARKELYDLSSDPREQKNVWGKRKKEIEAHYAIAKGKLREIEVKGKRR